MISFIHCGSEKRGNRFPSGNNLVDASMEVVSYMCA